jgi:hypothetical protein
MLQHGAGFVIFGGGAPNTTSEEPNLLNDVWRFDIGTALIEPFFFCFFFCFFFVSKSCANRRLQRVESGPCFITGASLHQVPDGATRQFFTKEE